MIELIFTMIFLIIVLVIGILSKKILYSNEHELSIENELNTFKDNYKVIESIDKASDFKLGSTHIYK